MTYKWMLPAVIGAIALAACAPAAVPTRAPAPAPTFTSVPQPTAAPTEPPASPSPSEDTPVSSENSGSTTGDPSRNVLDQAQVVPQPGEELLERGPVYLDSSELLVLESAPPQIRLHLTGSLPDPCHNLRVTIGEPDANKRIQIDVYTVVLNTELMCAQVLVPFEITVPVEGLAPGTYQVSINEQDLGSVTQ